MCKHWILWQSFSHVCHWCGHRPACNYMPFSVSKIICIRLYYNRECNILTILFLLLMSWQVFETTDVQPNSRRLFLIKLQDTSIPKTSNNFLCNTCVVSSLFWITKNPRILNKVEEVLSHPLLSSSP